MTHRLMPPRPRPRVRRHALSDRRLHTPAHVRLRLDGYQPHPCPLTPHHARTLTSVHAGIDRPRPRPCTVCHDHGQVWLHETLTSTPGALTRWTRHRRYDAHHHLTPLGAGQLDTEIVYGHPDATPLTRSTP